MSEHYDVIDDLGQPWVDVIQSDVVPPGRWYLMPRPLAEHEPLTLLWEREPTTVKGEAIKIVHEGLADVLTWLRQAGHEIPSWTARETQDSFYADWRLDAHASMAVLNPSGYSTVVTGL